jgi:hypothetical protein
MRYAAFAEITINADFQSADKKVCQELVHLRLDTIPRDGSYSPTSEGTVALQLLIRNLRAQRLVCRHELRRTFLDQVNGRGAEANHTSCQRP